MTDDEFASLRRDAAARMIGGRREREKNALVAELSWNGDDARALDDEMRRRAAEESAHGSKTCRARRKDALTDGKAALRAGFDHFADGLIAGHERIAHAGEIGHAPSVEKSFSAGADAAPVRCNDDIRVAGRVDRQAAERQPSGLLKDDGERIQHHRPSAHLARDPRWGSKNVSLI